MAQYINVTLQNSSATSQYIYHATDDVLKQPILQNTPLGPGENTALRLVADPSGRGNMTYGYSGGVDTSRTDLSDGDVVRSP